MSQTQDFKLCKTVRCVNCKHAQFVRSPTGRIRKKYAGRCMVEIPPQPKLICVSNPRPAFKDGIWYNSAGICDLYEKKED